MKLRVGLDFDNTLISYDAVFRSLALRRGWIPARLPASKSAVKELLLRADKNDLRWQALQAEAYGPGILKAKAFPGAEAFVRSALKAGHDVFIVSHKSESSHFDPSVRLRDWARRWLAKNASAIPVGCVFFEGTREEKVRRIAALKLDLFIDDLEEVLEHPAFPAGTAGLRFDARRGPLRRWSEAGPALAALAETGPRAFAALSRLGGRPLSAESLGHAGNNRLLKVALAGGETVLLKRYLVDSRDGRRRADAEFRALELMWSCGVRSIPRPLFLDEAGEFAVHSFLEGAPPAKIEQGHVVQAATFIERLTALRKPKGYPEAADSRRRLADYPAHIERRLKRVLDGAGELGHPKASAFIEKKLVPAKDRLLSAFARAARAEGLPLDAPIPDSERVLSPSDFGFHNALADHRGRLRFVDFEYFGVDDPAKLAADFIHHAGQKTPFELRRLFVTALAKSLPPGFTRRFALVQDLIGLEWILIVLNVLAPEARARRSFSDPGLDEKALVDRRLERAESMLAALEAGKKRLNLEQPALARK